MNTFQKHIIKPQIRKQASWSVVCFSADNMTGDVNT